MNGLKTHTQTNLKGVNTQDKKPWCGKIVWAVAGKYQALQIFGSLDQTHHADGGLGALGEHRWRGANANGKTYLCP